MEIRISSQGEDVFYSALHATGFFVLSGPQGHTSVLNGTVSRNGQFSWKRWSFYWESLAIHMA